MLKKIVSLMLIGSLSFAFANEEFKNKKEYKGEKQHLMKDKKEYKGEKQHLMKDKKHNGEKGEYKKEKLMDHKKKMNDKISERILNLENAKKCINQASSKEELSKCKPDHKK